MNKTIVLLILVGTLIVTTTRVTYPQQVEEIKRQPVETKKVRSGWAEELISSLQTQPR